VTPELSIARRAIATVVLAVALFAAVVIQLTVVNRLPLPGGTDFGSTGPDLVLLLVAAIAVATGPATGAVTGFAGGLAIDIAPPAGHYAGEYALVFCLVGYAAARVVRAIWNVTGEQDAVTTFTVMAVAVAAGEAGKAALGMLLSDPNVTTAAASRVLPAAILYDLVLSPLAYWFVTWVTRGAVGWRVAHERATAPELGAFQPALVFRQASAGAAPGLRLAGTGESYLSSSPARRVPKLRLSDVRTASSIRTTAAVSSGAPLHLAGAKTPRMNFSGSGRALATAPPGARAGARAPGKNWLGSSSSPAVPATKRVVHAPSPGWLRAGGRTGGAGGLAGGRSRGRTATRPRRFANGTGGTAYAAGSPLAARRTRSAGEALAARSAPSGVSALSGAGTPLARRRSPSRGWLRGSSTAVPVLPARRRSPRSGWLGSARRPRTVIGSGVRVSAYRSSAYRGSGAARGNWYNASPSGAWLRRGRHPWRKRSRRLLRLVGVGR
jgi:rod shape-determining protein MreD